MPKKIKKKVVIVRKHPRHVKVSAKNPEGITIVDQHLRILNSLTSDEILSVFKKYDKAKLVYPTRNNGRKEFPSEDLFDEIIAVWTDYFSKQYPSSTPLDPDIIKALLATESGFRIDPKPTKLAVGIAQITRETLKILQDPKGEVKDYIFKKIRIMDLKNPDIAIPMAVRWLFRKRELAKMKLKREPSVEEIILEYKGLLKSSSTYKESALTKFRGFYGKLKSK